MNSNKINIIPDSNDGLVLSDEQKHAIKVLKDFIVDGTEPCIVLVGAAGTGNIIAVYMRNYINYYKPITGKTVMLIP